MEAWASRVAWRLKGNVMVAPLNDDLLIFEFGNSEEEKRVLQDGRRSFKGDFLILYW